MAMAMQKTMTSAVPAATPIVAVPRPRLSAWV